MDSGLVLSTDMIIVLILLGITIYLFVFEVVRVDVAGLIILVALGLLNLVPSNQLFDGFASNAVLSIIAVMIIGAGLDRTGVMNLVASFIMRVGGKTESRIMSMVSATVGSISGFMQNVGATALFLPVVSRIASRTELPLSRLLMPMGFCAIMGGTLTMVGSSPLILLNDLIETSNRSLPQFIDTMDTFSLFAVTPVGLILLTSGLIYFLLLGRYLMPKGEVQSAKPGRTASYFADNYGINGEIFEVLVTVDSPLVGKTVAEAEADESTPLLLAIQSTDEARLAPPASDMFFVGTVIGVMGQREEVAKWAEAQHLKVQPRLRNFGPLFNPARAGISEVVIPPGSRLIGKTVGGERMRQRDGLSVLAIQRAEGLIQDEVRDVELKIGDTLITHSTWRDLAKIGESRDLVIVTDFPKEEARPHKVNAALTFFGIALLLVIFTSVQLPVALLVGAVGMILSGVLSIDEAYQAVSWKSVFLLASLIPLGHAMETTGTAAWIAQQTLDLLGDVPTWVLQSVIATLATFFSLVMSNVGATVLLVPLAINIALSVGADPAQFALLVALATSNAFIIPTHQVNALIMGPGGYRVADFLRVGTPMTIIYLVVLILSVNLIF